MINFSKSLSQNQILLVKNVVLKTSLIGLNEKVAENHIININFKTILNHKNVFQTAP